MDGDGGVMDEVIFAGPYEVATVQSVGVAAGT